MSNSIRIIEDQKGAGTSVTRVRQLFQDVEIRNKVIALIEGSDDKLCFNHLMSPNQVYLHPLNIRFHKKVINDLITEYPEKLISIRDADFSRVNKDIPSCSNMFITDAHDLETMMLKGGNLVALAADYPGLADNIDENALCENLKNYSYLKWYNYNGHKNIAFDKISTINLYENGKLGNRVALFSEVCAYVPVHCAKFEEYDAFCKNHPIDTNDVFSITNGHDLMDCIYSEMHKCKKSNLHKRKMQKSFCKNYNIQMFKKTLLYTQLYQWGERNGRHLF